MTGLRFSCVVDNSPLFRMQALNWVWTILGGGLTHPEGIVVYLVQGNDRDFQLILEKLGVTVRRIERFGTGDAAFCNKLLQLDYTSLQDIDCVVMCDADIAFAGDIRPWVTTTHVRAKVVDFTNPRLEALERLYAATGLTADPRIVEASFDRGPTFGTNCNGGLYMIPTQWLETLTGAWVKWARFALERGDILGDRRKNADQIGFCFAMLELGFPFDPLPEALNFPTHLSIESYSLFSEVDPLVLHYHKRLDKSGFLLPLALPHANSAIDRVNRVIADHRHRQFDNRTFWDYRYAYHSALGSGIGSRGDSLTYKRCVVQQTVESKNPSSILDIGCGDQSVTEGIPDDRYTGIDLSPVVIEQARKRYPERHYINGDFLEQSLPQYALTLCFDVVIHLDNIDRYREFVRRVVSSTSEYGIIAGYEAPPELSSEITFFHEPLSETLRKTGALNLCNLGRYRDTDIWHFSAAHGAVDSCRLDERTRQGNSASGGPAPLRGETSAQFGHLDATTSALQTELVRLKAIGNTLSRKWWERVNKLALSISVCVIKSNTIFNNYTSTRERDSNLLKVPYKFNRNARHIHSIGPERTGSAIIKLVIRRLGVNDLSSLDILDIGCGVRLAQTIINCGIPVKSYTGVDVDQDLIDFLRENVRDQRFSFQAWDICNAMYNPHGAVMTKATTLPVQGDFDLIWLFSVFTHLCPSDTDALLCILRRYVRKGGYLFFTAFIDNSIETFEDRIPEKPLLNAYYSESYMRSLLSQNSWSLTAMYEKDELNYVQHYFVCRPV